MPRGVVLTIALVLLIVLGPLLTLQVLVRNLRRGRTRHGMMVLEIVVLLASVTFVVWAFMAHPGEEVRTVWTPAVYVVVGVIDAVALILLGLAAGRRGRPQSSTAWIVGVALLMTLFAGIGNALVFYLWGPYGFG